MFLFVLGLLATDALIERLSILRRIEGKVERELAHVVHGTPTAKDVFCRGLKPFDEPGLRAAESISISGVSLLNLAVHYGKLLGEMASNGCRIRLLFMNPKWPGVADPSPASVSHQIETMQSILGSLGRAYEWVEIKCCEYNPPHGLVIVDGDKPFGYLIVTYYPYRCPTGERPQAVLRKLDSDPWYDFYLRQFEVMWEDAVPWLEIL